MKPTHELVFLAAKGIGNLFVQQAIEKGETIELLGKSINTVINQMTTWTPRQKQRIKKELKENMKRKYREGTYKKY